MIKYFTKRILYVLPTILGICLITFILTELIPGDPVATKIVSEDLVGRDISLSKMHITQDQLRGKLNLNKPLFYFSLESLAIPKEVHHLESPLKRQAVKKWALMYGCKNEIWSFF